MVPGLRIDPIRERHYGRWFVLVALLGVMGVLGWFVYGWYTTGAQPPLPLPLAVADPRVDESEISKQAIETHETKEKQHPRYLTSEALSIDKARIQDLGIGENNLLALPKNLHDIGWYNKSSTPGQGYGVVVIDGHSLGNKKLAAFEKISSFEKGDEISIERGDGKTFTYQAVDNHVIRLEDFNNTGMKLLMQSAKTGKEGLNVLVPSGTWVPRLNQFAERTIVRLVLATDDTQSKTTDS